MRYAVCCSRLRECSTFYALKKATATITTIMKTTTTTTTTTTLKKTEGGA
jgi:predicted metal-binding transcription factor (methanogenesis marker protein 9)